MVSSSKETTNLDETQQCALSAFRAGKCIALLGGAGSGKSYVLCQLIAEAEKMYGKYPHVVACALTNRAANEMRGTTIHSLFGAKPSWEFSKKFLWDGIKDRPAIVDRLRRIKVLFIDEISLLKANEIDAIDHILRMLAEDDSRSSLPFGGRIVVFAGDPFQLEPYEELSSVQVETRDTAYQSRSWYLTFGPLGEGVVIVLHQNYRQSKDPDFYQMLNRIRVGGHSGEDLSLLNVTSDGLTKPPQEHTRLFPTNAQVASINGDILSRIPGDLIRFTAMDTFFARKTSSLEARLTSAAPKEVVVKVGARVILARKVRNILPGAQCVVHRILNLTRVRNNPRFQVDLRISSMDPVENNTFVRVGVASFDVHGYNREVIASRDRIPLIPGYAMTIHRSQGLTMEHVAIDFSAVKKWRPVGLVYVALSRCRTLSGLWIKNLKDHHIRVSPRAFQLMNDIWTLRTHSSFRVHGVKHRTCLGFDDSVDCISISDQESEEEEDVLFVCDNLGGTQVLKQEESLQLTTDSHKTLSNKRIMQDPMVHGKRRCFVWERRD